MSAFVLPKMLTSRVIVPVRGYKKGEVVELPERVALYLSEQGKVEIIDPIFYAKNKESESEVMRQMRAHLSAQPTYVTK